METADLLKKVRKIEIKTRGISRNIFSGEYHSTFKGRGMSFSEVRNYQFGDDVRNIDWNVTARTGEPYVKIFEEERELTLLLMVDLSGSVFFGSQAQLKNELLTEICAVLAFSAISNNDKVGVIFFSDTIEKYIPPKKGKKHILLIIRELLQIESKGTKTNIRKALEFANNVNKKSSIIFLLSDFLADDYENPLKIMARKHDVIGLQMIDPLEKDMPNLGLIRAKDLETGITRLLDTSAPALRKARKERFDHFNQYFLTNFVKSGASMIRYNTSTSYIKALLQFFKTRNS